MIPPFNASMVLPPFYGATPTNRAGMSPYQTSMSEIVQRFATSKGRVAILEGLLAYRKEMAKIGLVDGFQWIDGSFVEDIETSQEREPNDIDIVTFAIPGVDKANFRSWFASNMDLFNPAKTKILYKCDAYFVDMLKPPHLLVNDTRYWFGLFGHQRTTTLWKGMLEVSLVSDDAAATTYINSRSASYQED